MRLFEAIIDANRRALAGDTRAGIRPVEFAESLPVVALTCIDARLNPLIPEVFGISEEQFIWLRNAGNIISGPLSSTMRSVALACAVKGGREIAIIGHTDCLVGKTTMMQLLEALKQLGVRRESLPQNLTEYFGLFASERQNVLKGVETARSSPLVGHRIPVHGLLLETGTGRLEWLVNGYQAIETAQSADAIATNPSHGVAHSPVELMNIDFGEMKFPTAKIGEAATSLEKWIEDQLDKLEPQKPAPAPQPPVPPPLPPQIASTAKAIKLLLRKKPH